MTASWVPGADGSGFGLENLPYGVVRPPAGAPRPAVRIGDHALDLAALGDESAFRAPDLNAFLALGPGEWEATRAGLTALLAAGSAERPPLHRLCDVDVLLPVRVGDYVDFYASLEHATTMGRILRPGGEPLAPNWRHMPVGYHGRAGTIVVSGTPVRRPRGPRGPGDFGPERKLDVELELGFVAGAQAVFGCVLVNDWSAREIQRWEHRPLGPFLAKSFATSISPWVVPLEALAERRVAGRVQDPPPPEYLRTTGDHALDVDLELALAPAGARETVLSRVNARTLYWTYPQMLAHATVNGATVRPGDLFASGTISAPGPGSLVELTWDGRDPVRLDGGAERTFLEDGDTVIMRGTAGTVSLGEVRGQVVR